MNIPRKARLITYISEHGSTTPKRTTCPLKRDCRIISIGSIHLDQPLIFRGLPLVFVGVTEPQKWWSQFSEQVVSFQDSQTDSWKNPTSQHHGRPSSASQHYCGPHGSQRAPIRLVESGKCWRQIPCDKTSRYRQANLSKISFCLFSADVLKHKQHNMHRDKHLKQNTLSVFQKKGWFEENFATILSGKEISSTKDIVIVKLSQLYSFSVWPPFPSWICPPPKSWQTRPKNVKTTPHVPESPGLIVEGEVWWYMRILMVWRHIVRQFPDQIPCKEPNEFMAFFVVCAWFIYAPVN